MIETICRVASGGNLAPLRRPARMCACLTTASARPAPLNLSTRLIRFLIKTVFAGKIYGLGRHPRAYVPKNPTPTRTYFIAGIRSIGNFLSFSSELAPRLGGGVSVALIAQRSQRARRRPPASGSEGTHYDGTRRNSAFMPKAKIRKIAPQRPSPRSRAPRSPTSKLAWMVCVDFH